MSSEISETSGLADDIFNPGAYQAISPIERQFAPWHRPRKQFVRDRQWVDQVKKLYDESTSPRNEFRYLGLPGLDLLDLRFFHSEICQPRDLRMSFLGFNSEALDGTRAQIALNISMDEVRKFASVDERSEVISDDFFGIANVNSIAYKKTVDIGPYDVINLDLCDGLGAPASVRPGHSAHEALARIIPLQFRHKHPWLLLLTTRVGRAHVEQAFLDKLLGKYNENLRSCAAFQKSSMEHFTIENLVTLANAAQTDSGLVPIYLTGIFKWLAGFALESNPPSKLELKSVIGYKVEPSSECEDLWSIALRFTPTFDLVNDSTGIVGLSPKSNLSECTMSVAALKRVSKRVDADLLLNDDADLKATMIDSMANLLAAARYSKDEYLQWIGPQ